MTRLDLFGEVGVDFTPTAVRFALNPGEDVTVSINSGGGYAADGAAIHAMLTEHRGKVTVEVIGIAASAASLIAMAGDTITMADGAVMMIHDPMNITVGNSADHAKTIEELEAYATAYARIYAKRVGISERLAREIMKAETWFDGPAAVTAGFATSAGTAKAAAFASYDYSRYRHGVRAMAQATTHPPAEPAWKRVVANINKRNGTASTNDDAEQATPGKPWAKVVKRMNDRLR